jgi:PAS domain S-box-containing protein
LTVESTQALIRPLSGDLLARTGQGARRYALAILAGAVAFLLILLIEVTTQDLVLSPALVAVLVAAWYGGLGPGVFTLAVVVALLPSFAVIPHGAAHSLADYLTPVLLFIPLGLLTAVFGHQGRLAMNSFRRSEHLFHAFMGNLPGAAWMKDTDGRYTYANDEAVRVFRTPREVLYGKVDEQIFPNEVARQFVENDRLAIARRDAVQTVEAMDQDDGVHQSLVVKFPVLDAQRAVEFVGGVAIDITDRHRAEQALAARSEQLQLLFDTVPVLVSYVDRDHRYVFNSKSYEDWFGQARGELTGRLVEEVVGAEAYADIGPHLDRALAGEVVEYEAQLPYAEGGSRWVEARYVPDRNPAGEVVGLFATVLDVTAHKQLEIERSLLADVTGRLGESFGLEETALRLVEALVPAFVDGAAVYLAADEGAETRGVALSSSPTAEVPELRTYTVDRDAPRGVGSVFRTGRPEYYRRVPADLDLPARVDATIAASPARLSLMLTPIKTDDTVVAVIAAWTDTSARICEQHDFDVLQEIAWRAGLAIRHSMLYDESMRIAEELRVASNAKDEFLGTVSHELRTPITIILGNASLLANRYPQMDKETVSASLGDLLGQAERLHRVVENMLILARLESGDAVEPEPIPIARSISQVVSEAQRQQPGRVIRLESSDWDLFALGAESYIHQVLLNYINNAMRYSPASEPVDIAVRSEGNVVQVTVLDRGIGVSEEDLEGLFKPFYRSARIPEQAQGMGIGLSVSKRLIEALGGSVWATHREGGGAEFGFALPAAAHREPGELELTPQPRLDIRAGGSAESEYLHNE